MSALHLRLEIPCTAEQLALVAQFAAEHNAETWSTNGYGELVTAVDLDALTAVDPEPMTWSVDRVTCTVEPVEKIIIHDDPPVPPIVVDEPPPANVPEPPKGTRAEMTVREMVLSAMDEHEGAFYGNSTALSREAHPDNPASALATIGKMEKSGELTFERDGRFITAVFLTASKRGTPIDLAPTPAPEPVHPDKTPFDVDKARLRAAGAL